MRLQDFTSSKQMTRLGLFLARHTPPWVGYGLARIAANLIARRQPEIYWTGWANLRQVVGPKMGDGALHEMARRVFFHAGQTYYDFFHAIDQPPEVLIETVRVPESLITQIRSKMAQGQGVLLLGTHMSNFDLAGLAIGARGLPIQILSLADPQAGFHILNRLRAQGCFEVTPITPQSLRAAIRRLKSGGLVLTGVDRPVLNDRELGLSSQRRIETLIEFFGRPAYLPVGPARLALMTRAVVFIGSCHYDPGEGYILEATGPVEIARTGDRRRDILTNTRHLAAVVEGYVRAHPEQWMMFHSIWPESPGYRS
jgi:lauroyl/myristoyl acyltransferase